MHSFEQTILNQKPKPTKTQVSTYACLEQPQTLDFLKYLKLPPSSTSSSTSNNTNNMGNQNCLYFNTDHQQNISTGNNNSNSNNIGNNNNSDSNSNGNNTNANGRKTKKFEFDDIYSHTQKLKFQFSQLINQTTQNALKGQNQTFIIYGTQQKCKDHIIFGQSQNPGLFLCILSQLFNKCHQKCIQDEITIKLVSTIFNKSQFIDIFGGNRQCEIEYSRDYIQGNILHIVPEIIIRNVKTGLKLVNIILKYVYDRREEEFTENFIITMKLEIDCKRVNYGGRGNKEKEIGRSGEDNQRQQTQIYCISKINFIKLANPSINNSLKGINKNNIWFINLFNFIQNPSVVINSSNNPNNSSVPHHAHGNNNHHHHQQSYTDIVITNPQPQHGKWDIFTQYLIQNFFKTSYRIYGFVSITNKMSSNQCLTALLFGSYLKNFKLQVQFNQEIHSQMYGNGHGRSLSNGHSYPPSHSHSPPHSQQSQPSQPQTLNLHLQLINLQKITKQHTTAITQIFQQSPYIKSSQLQLKYWQEYITQLQNYMHEFNYLEFQYSLIIGEACEKLNKYIFTEKLEDFFYAKKISLEVGEDLVGCYTAVKRIKDGIRSIRKKIIQDINSNITATNKHQTQILKTKIQKLFDMQFSLAHHFLLQNTQLQKFRLKVSNIQKLLSQTKNKSKDHTNTNAYNRDLSMDLQRQLKNTEPQNYKQNDRSFMSKQKQKQSMMKNSRKYQSTHLEKTFTSMNAKIGEKSQEKLMKNGHHKQQASCFNTTTSKISNNYNYNNKNQGYSSNSNSNSQTPTQTPIQSQMNTTAINHQTTTMPITKKPPNPTQIDNLESMFKNKNVGISKNKNKIAMDYLH